MNTRNYKTAAPQSNIIDPWRPVIEKQMCIKKEKRGPTQQNLLVSLPNKLLSPESWTSLTLKAPICEKAVCFFQSHSRLIRYRRSGIVGRVGRHSIPSVPDGLGMLTNRTLSQKDWEINSLQFKKTHANRWERSIFTRREDRKEGRRQQTVSRGH